MRMFARTPGGVENVSGSLWGHVLCLLMSTLCDGTLEIWVRLEWKWLRIYTADGLLALQGG